MASEKNSTSAAESVSAASEFDMTVSEFCLRLSTEKVGPEMIAGFDHSQKSKGIVKSSNSKFRAAFAKFAADPA